MDSSHPEIGAEIKEKMILSGELEEKMRAAIREFKQTRVASDERGGAEWQRFVRSSGASSPIQSTAKTTRAMSLVAGSKMRRAQQMALAHRPYADAAALAAGRRGREPGVGRGDEGAALHPLLEQREVKTPRPAC